jgi:DNA-binding transcriptional regulator YiaG
MPKGVYPRPSIAEKLLSLSSYGNPGCWVQAQGDFVGGGYARFIVNGTRPLTHRRVWTLLHGAIPSGLDVLHRCDNPPCWRPSHLWLGTHKDNMQDASQKGRMNTSRNQGELCAAAKLTGLQVVEIRRRYAAGGVTQAVLASCYGVEKGAISKIVRGERWRHV